MNRPIDVQALGGNQAIPELVGDPVEYWLPPGMHPCTMEDVQAMFVYNDQRRKVWTCFEAFLHRFRDANGRLSKVILDGSFVTGREHPDDIDAFTLFNAHDMAECYQYSDNKLLFNTLRKKDFAKVIFNIHLFFVPNQSGFEWYKNFFSKGDNGAGSVGLRPPDKDRDPPNLIVPAEKGLLELDLTDFFNRGL